MRAFRVEFYTDNAAFGDDQAGEIAAALRKVARRIEQGERSGKVMDTNGNSVGLFGSFRASS